MQVYKQNMKTRKELEQTEGIKMKPMVMNNKWFIYSLSAIGCSILAILSYIN
jgi:hypothetical protein